MKYLKCFLIVGVMLLLTSSYTTRSSRLSEGLYPGNLMPELELNDESGKSFSLEHLRGVKVLVNFWAAYDAESHMENVLLWNTLQKKEYPVVMLSVSFDRSKGVFEKTLSMDGIKSGYQFCDTDGQNSKVYKKYELEKGFKNYLVDEKGVIVAMNLTPGELENLLN